MPNRREQLAVCKKPFIAFTFKKLHCDKTRHLTKNVAARITAHAAILLGEFLKIFNYCYPNSKYDQLFKKAVLNIVWYNFEKAI